MFFNQSPNLAGSVRTTWLQVSMMPRRSWGEEKSRVTSGKIDSLTRRIRAYTCGDFDVDAAHYIFNFFYLMFPQPHFWIFTSGPASKSSFSHNNNINRSFQTIYRFDHIILLFFNPGSPIRNKNIYTKS